MAPSPPLVSALVRSSVLSSITTPGLEVLISPPCSLTLRTVTFGALMFRCAPFVNRMSCTTAPAVLTSMSVDRTCAGTQPCGTPVVDGFGNPPGAGWLPGGGAAGAGGAALGEVALAARTTVNRAVLGLLRWWLLSVATIVAR